MTSKDACPTRSTASTGDRSLAIYDFTELLRDGVPGKYAKSYRSDTNLVLLDPDVAKAFPNAEAINEALRLVIKLRKVPTRE